MERKGNTVKSKSENAIDKNVERELREQGF